MLKKIKNYLKKFKVIRKLQDFYRNEILLKERVKSIGKNGSKVVSELEGCLKSTHLVFFASCGTLLGLVREKKLLQNDYDLDYSIIVEKEDNWKILEDALLKFNYKKIREFKMEGKTTEMTFKNKKKIEVDFFGCFQEDNMMSFYSYDKLNTVKYPTDNDWTVYEIKTGKFEGTTTIDTDIGQVTIPKNYDEYLSSNYNDNWRIPDPNFKSNTGKHCYMLENKLGHLTTY